MKELFELGDEALVSPGAALPGGAMAAKMESPSVGGPADLARLAVSAVWRRWYVVLGVALPLGALSVFAAAKKFQPAFAAEAMIEVAPTVPSVAFTDEQWRAQSIHGFYDNYMRTLMRLAKVRPVLEGARQRLSDDGINWRPPAVTEAESTDHLGARIQVNAIRETHLFSVRFEDADPGLVAPVANAVTTSLLTHLEETAAEQRRKRREIIEDERERLRLQLRDTYAALEPMSARLGSALIDDRHNVFFERLNTLTEGMTKVFVDRVRREGELEGVRKRASLLLQEVPFGELEALVDEDRAVADARVTQGRLAREIESSTGALSDEHPERAQALKRLASARAQGDQIEEGARVRIRARLQSQREEQAARLLTAAEGSVEGARWSEERMQNVLGDAEEQLVEHGRAQIVARELRTEADRLLATMRMLDQRVDELQMEANAASRVVLRAPAVEPRRPTGDKRPVVALVGLLFSGALGLALGIALEWLRQPVRRDADLKELGPVTRMDERSRARLAFQLSSATRPTLLMGMAGVCAEELRAVGADLVGRVATIGEVVWFDLLPGCAPGREGPVGVQAIRLDSTDQVVLPAPEVTQRIAAAAQRQRVLGTVLADPHPDPAASVRDLGCDVVLVVRRHRTRLAWAKDAAASGLVVRGVLVLERRG